MPEKDQIKKYISLLYSRCEKGFMEFRSISPDGEVDQKFFPISGCSSSSSSSDEAADYLQSVAGAKHAYAGVCPRSEKDGSKTSVKELNAVWADVDAKDFSIGKSSLLSQIKSDSPRKPSLVIDSGNGFHVYWLLQKPFSLQDNRESVEELIKRYHSAVGGDYTHDITRILRVAGTENIKNPQNQKLCKFEQINDVRYSITELAEPVKKDQSITIEELRKKLPQRALQRAREAPDRFEDDRSGNDYYVAQKLSQVGLDQEEIQQAFQLFAQRGWDAGSKYRERGDEYLDHLLDGTLVNQREQLDSTLETIRESNSMPNGALEEACQIIANLPPVQRDMKQNELQDALGGRNAVSIKSIRQQVEMYSDGHKTPETATEAGQQLLDRTDYLNLEGNLFYYEDGVYKPDGEERIKSELQEIYANEWSRKRRDDAIEWVKDQRYKEIDQLPENEGLVNVKNGVYDIFEDELREHDPSYQFIWQVDADYRPEAKHERLSDFMSEVFYEEDIPVAWEHCGYCLLPWFNLKKFLILVGEGDNGKSVFLNMIENVLGEESVSHETLHSLTSNRFASRQLFGKLANICADITAERVNHVEILKTLTGGDKIRAEIKHGSVFSFRNQAKLLFSANEVPNMSDISKAFFRRLHLIRCPNEFPPSQRDPNLLSKLTTEEAKSAWLNKALSGAKRLLQNEQFSSSEKMEEEITEYRQSVDSVTEFLQTSIEPSESAYETQKALYDAYRGWCERNGRQAVSSNVFESRAKIEPNNLQEATKTLENGTVQVYEGIRLKSV